MRRLHQTWTWALSSAVAVAGIGTVFITHRDPAVPDANEFFRRNPHLTAPPVKATAVPEVVRTSDEFLPGDFRLEKGQVYPVAITHDFKMTGGEQDLLSTGIQGTMNLHSLGVHDRKLTVVADFKIDRLSGVPNTSDETRRELGMKEEKKSNKPVKSARASQAKTVSAPTPVSVSGSRLLVELSPDGRIQRVLTTDRDQDPAALETKLTILALTFRRLPPLKTGSHLRTEPDLHGTGYPVQYTIAESAEGRLRVRGEAKLNQKLGESTAKASAAGLPDLSLVPLESDRRESFDWVWNAKTSRPETQLAESASSIRHLGTSVSGASGKARTQWSAPSASTFVSGDLKGFTVPVDFRGTLDRSRNRILASAGQGPKRRTWAELHGSLNHLERLTDGAREDLFLDFARAVQEDPTLVGSAHRAALDAPAGSREVSMVLGALGFSGTPEAQAAMIDIFNRPRATEDEKQKVMTEFALASGPLTADTKTFLRASYQSGDPLKSDVSGSAALALGASIARDGDPETVRFLRSEWKSSDDESRQAFMLAAMGNSRSDAFVNEVKSAADSELPVVRAAAANAVRFAQDSESREVLFTALRRDPSSEVQITAAQSMLYQPFDDRTRTVLQDCSQNGSPNVKLECYRALGVRIEQPGVREFLRSRQAAEADPQVQSLISNTLALEAAPDAK